ncbi:MAG: hypothetical protein ACK5PW_04290 [Burkholderiales bacterium]
MRSVPVFVAAATRLARPAARVCLGLLAVLSCAPASAHEGHVHDDEAARTAPAPSASAAPRFGTASELFELVGALDGRRLVLWLDRAADTSPVTDATLELEIAGRSMRARPAGDTYVIELDAPLAPGRVAIVATVEAGGDTDLLAVELVVPAPAGATPAGGAPSSGVATAAPDSGSLPGASAVTAHGDAVRTASIAALAAACAAVAGWALGRRRRDGAAGSRP